MLNFIVPVRHHESVSDWASIKENIKLTFNSISKQEGINWHCYVIANRHANLPELPGNFTLVSVDFPLNKIDKETLSTDDYYDEIRRDKGSRIYEGLKKCSDDSFIMVVDYDDFVNVKLSRFLEENNTLSVVGYKINEGYLYSSGLFAIKDKNFDEMCGTSNIVKLSFIKSFYVDGELPLVYVKRLLGSHKYIKHEARQRGFLYPDLPFPGAIYNVGIAQSTSQAPAVFLRYFTIRKLLSNPLRFINSIFKIRVYTSSLKKLFGTV